MIEPTLASLFPTSEEIPERFRWTVDDTGLSLLVDGEVRRFGGDRQTIHSAVAVRSMDGALTPLPLGPAALAGEAEGLAAVEAAARAWANGRGEWPRASTATRIACCRDWLGRVEALRERVALALMWEVGKPWKDALVEVDRTVEYVRATLDTLAEMERSAAAPVLAGGFAARVRRAPLGVALCLGPYNYAINEVFTLVVPALLMGNPVVIKTPRYGVLANALLAPSLAASFPRGVVNLVTGSGPSLVGPMMASGRVDVLAFIGSARTAAILERQHPHPYRLRRVLGMGAKNPAIVLADADLERAAAEIVAGALTFNGQRCTAIKHVLVDRRVAEPLVERLAARVSALGVGMPWQEGVTVTPLPDPAHPAYLAGLVEDAVGRGARVVNRGGGESAGSLVRPAVVYPVVREARLFVEEQFGPLVPVSTFDTPEEAVGIVERSEFGQQVALFGRAPELVGPLLDHLANLVCRVNLDTQCRRGPDVYPFTGRKDSAVGTLSISDALRVFSLRSLVATTEAQAARLAELGATSRFLAPPPD